MILRRFGVRSRRNSDKDTGKDGVKSTTFGETIMSERTMLAQPVELLSFTAGETNGRPIVLITLRPHPKDSPRSKLVAITRAQAQRAYDDLGAILADNDDSWIGGI